MRPWMLLMALAASGCTGAPGGGTPAQLGVGTPGVSGFMPANEDDSLAAELRRCDGHVEGGLAAACAQLRSTLRNQPGNDAGTVARR